MSKLIRYITVIVAWVLTGCATFNVPSDYSLAHNSNQGLVVMSLTHSVASVIVDYRPVAAGKPGAGSFMTGNMQDPLDWTHPNGRLVVAELPPGQYELYQWRAEGMNVTYTSKLFSIPFTIEAGKATYIGNLFINMDETTAKYTLSVTDTSARDLPLLIRHYPNIKQTDVSTEISKIFR